MMWPPRDELGIRGLSMSFPEATYGQISPVERNLDDFLFEIWVSLLKNWGP